MTGTLINTAAILLGGALGLFFGARLPERLKGTVIAGLGLFVTALGVQMFLKTGNALVVLGALLPGGLLGEWWRIEERLRGLGAWLERRFARNDSADGANRFIRGFLTATLVFCIGPMAILGSIQDGLSGDYQVLAIKSVLDGFAALAFASTLGPGVLFAALPTLLYQGGLSLLAGQLNGLVSPAMLNELTATGGILLMGIGLGSLLELAPIRVGNFLPALALAPLIVFVLGLLPK